MNVVVYNGEKIIEMKLKGETGGRKAMLTMRKGCHRTHRVEKESDIIVWLSIIYLQFRSNKTD